MKKKFRKTSIVALLLVLVMLAATACGGGDTGSSSGGESSGTPSEDTTVYDLVCNMTFIEVNAPGVAAAFERATERSNGRLKFTIYWGNTLLNVREIPRGVEEGQAHISLLPLNMYTDQMQLTSLMAQPFLGFKDKDHALGIIEQLHSEFPEIEQEYTDLGLTRIGFYALPPYQLHMTTTNPIRVPEDLGGDKIITTKLEISDFFNAINCAPINSPITELFSSLESGVANGVVQMGAVLSGFNLLPLLNQHVIFPTGTHFDYCTFVVQTEMFNSLPADLQQILREELLLAAEAQKGQEQMQADINYKEQEDAGKLFVYITEDELALWRAPVLAINESMISRIEANKPIARDVASRLRELIAQ